MAIVVITGASSGIGAATARVLAKAGHSLVLAARRADRLVALQAELREDAPVEIAQTDVVDHAHVEAMMNLALERFGRIDVLINNAGVGQRGRQIWELELEEIERILDTNLRAAIVATRFALRDMMPRRSGHIINVASIAGHLGMFPIYSASKFGLRGFSEGLRRQVSSYGIHVSVVSPGFIRTEMTESIRFPMPGPERLAQVVARLVERPRREVLFPGWYRLLAWGNWLAPGLVDWATPRVQRRVAGSKVPEE